MEQTTIAPKKEKQQEPQAPVYTDEHPEFPKLLYNHEKRTTKAARDKEDEEKLAKDGFVEEPLPPEDPDALTPKEVEDLQALLAKAAKALAKLGQLSQDKEKAHASDKPQANTPPKK